MAGSQEFAGAELVGTVGVFYTDPQDVRFELALETAEAYRDAGLPYVVVDASPGQAEGRTWVADAHTERGAIVVEAEIPGIATQRKQGVAYAVTNGAEKIVGQEPEKTRLPDFAGQISAALNTYDVLVIGRTQEAEDSLPPVQQRTERLAGWILEQAHALPHDALSGGRGFTVAGAEVLADYPATEPGMNNWIYLYDTPLEARRRGLRVGGIAVELAHPPEMVAQETGNPDFDKKRYEQFKLQLDYLLDPHRVAQPSGLSRFVYRNLHQMGAQASNGAHENVLARIEARCIALGYQPAERLRVQ